MRKSLFALESSDEMGDDSEMEVGVEEGEAAGVLTDTADDTVEIGDIGEAVSEGTDAAGQMGQVEDLVEDAAENSGGLDPVAAEAIRISVEAICARVGANPRTVYSLYAVENFQSASSRKANTRIALEGVTQFLKDLWAKIKASLKTLWAKIKAFWEKHVSSLGRVKKALDSAKARVSASTGKFKGQAYLDDAPSGLVSAFPGKDTISPALITKFLDAHDGATGEMIKFLEASPITAAIEMHPALKLKSTKAHELNLGTASAPLVGGKYASVRFSVVGSSTKDEDTFEFEVTREVIDDKETKLGITLADKTQLQAVLKSTLEMINATIKIKEKYFKFTDANNKLMNDMDKLVNEAEAAATKDSDKVKVKQARNVLSFYYKANAKMPGLSAEMLNANVTLAKAVLGYAAVSIKNYK